MTTKRRRTKGEGSITKMANSKYRVRLDCGYVDGKRKQLSGTADSLTEARVLLRGFMKLREEADIAVSMNMTFEALTKNFMEYKKTRTRVKETTLYHYTSNLNSLQEHFKDKSISKITTKDVDEFIIKLRNEGKKESTIKLRLTVLGLVFKYAIKTLKILRRSPLEDCLYVESAQLKKDIKILSESEFETLRAILQEVYTERLEKHPNNKPNNSALCYIAFLLAYELGLREGEVLGLRWSRIDFQNHLVHIDNQRIKVGSEVKDGSPKSKASDRVIVVSDGLIKILTQHKASFQFSEQDDYVFSKDFNGTKILIAESLRNSFTRFLLKAGITRHFTFHMLRHTNATRLIELTGNDYKTVSERLGHASVSVTFNVYAHTIKKQHQLAANLMDCTK